MSIHLISTDRFGRRSYLIFSFYIIQNSLPKVNYPSRLVPIPFGVPISYIPHPSFPSAWLLLPALFFISLFFSYPPIPEPSAVGAMYVSSCFLSLRTCFVRVHALFPSRMLLSRTRLQVLPWFVPFLVSLRFPLCFYPSSSRSDDLASVHGTLSSDTVAIIMIAINDTCAESSVVQ